MTDNVTKGTRKPPDHHHNGHMVPPAAADRDDLQDMAITPNETTAADDAER